MNREGPLANPRLQAIEAALDAGTLDEAQHLLADLGDAEDLGPGTSFLATRLLYLRGRLDGKSLAQRLRDLLRQPIPFPEAEHLLRLAESGELAAPELPQPSSSPRHPVPTPKPPAETSQRITSSLPPPLPVTSALGSLALPTSPRISERPGWPGRLKTPGLPPLIEPPLEPPQGLKLATSLDLPPPESAPGLAEPVDIPDLAPPAASASVVVEVTDAEEAIQSDPPFAGLADSLEPPEPNPSDVDMGWSSTASETGDVSLPSPAHDRVLGAPQVSDPVNSAHQLPNIPRAPGIPKFAPPPDLAPSYVPPGQSLRAAQSGGPASFDAQQAIVKLRGQDGSVEATSEGPDQLRLVVDSRPEALTRPLPALVKVPGAGRYSGSPSAAEVVWTRVSPHEKREEGPPATASTTGTAGRSAESPGAFSAPPTLFEVASLLDEGRFDSAIRVLDLAPITPEQQLLRARALSGAGRTGEAIACVRELCENRQLDSELRAGAARLLIELGELDPAIEQARLAMGDAPDTALVRLTLAWSALRLARRSEKPELVIEASRALDGLRSRGGPHPALVLALRACVHAHSGEHVRAIAVAQRSLSLDPRGADALAAIAIASAALGDSGESEHALTQLHASMPAEADVLTRFLRKNAGRSSRALEQTFSQADDARSVWDAAELELLAGHAQRAVGTFEQLCRERLTELSEHDPDPSFSVLAELAAGVLAQAPVFTHFAPYDFSPESAARVSAALDVLYQPEQLPRVDLDEFPSLLLVGSYLGQLVCDQHEGEWRGTVLDLPGVEVALPQSKLHPFRDVAARLSQGTPLELGVMRARASGRDLWSQRRSTPMAPASPWGTTWPQPEDVPRLGRALAHSVPSRWCEQHAGRALDGSFESIAALDRYLDLIAPPGLQPSSAMGWAPRVAVLVGGYLGEVLRALVGGTWLPPRTTGSLGPDSYRVRISETETTPVAKVYARTSGRGAAPLVDYASRFLK